jgi:hypothetical protein
LFNKAREDEFYVFTFFGRNLVKLKVIFLRLFLPLFQRNFPVFQVITLVSNKNHIKIALAMFFDRLEPVIDAVKRILICDRVGQKESLG